jgi:hypothetical protein
VRTIRQLLAILAAALMMGCASVRFDAPRPTWMEL